MTIEEYEPRSMLVTRETPARRAKFPFVDIHGHQDLTMSDAELASLVKQMDAMNMRVMNNLSGGWCDKLAAAQVRNVPDRLSTANALITASNGKASQTSSRRGGSVHSPTVASAAVSRYSTTLYIMAGTR